MGETSLVVANSIKVLTQNGECQIDLCLGDITKLKRKDKVDVICVSAFQGKFNLGELCLRHTAKPYQTDSNLTDSWL